MHAKHAFRAVAAIAVTACAVPAAAQRENAGSFEVQLGVLASTGALGTVESGSSPTAQYQVRLQAAPTVALVWHRRGSDQMRTTRAVVEATPYLWGRASPTSGCVGFCQPTGFTLLSTALGADLVLSPSRGPVVSTYLAFGARARAYFLAGNACPAVPGAFCAGTDPLTEATIRPGLAVAAGAKVRDGARELSIEVGYLPTWVRNGRVQHDLRVALGLGS
jgi:hypothetical protein